MPALVKHNGVEYRVEGDDWGLRRCDPEPGDDATYEAVVDLFCARLDDQDMGETRPTTRAPTARRVTKVGEVLAARIRQPGTPRVMPVVKRADVRA